MKKTELIPTNGAKSFYGKAILKESDKYIYLESYGTFVAKYNKENKELKVAKNKKLLTSTTLKHIREFQTLFGYKPQTKNEILND